MKQLASPGLSTPVSAMGPSSRMRLTKMWPAAFLMVQPIPCTGSLIRVTLLTPVKGSNPSSTTLTNDMFKLPQTSGRLVTNAFCLLANYLE